MLLGSYVKKSLKIKLMIEKILKIMKIWKLLMRLLMCDVFGCCNIMLFEVKYNRILIEISLILLLILKYFL